MPCPQCPNPNDPHPDPGTFCFVVGPSGVGKDTLIDGAHKELTGCRRFHFARRIITRSGDAGGEHHQPMEIAAFEEKEKAGYFALAWAAHGRHYGIGKNVLDHLAAGRHVIANGSRRMIASVRTTFPRAHIIHVTAPKEILARRLLARGRETPAEIEERLSREAPLPAPGPAVSIVGNGDTRAEGVRRFLKALAALAPDCVALEKSNPHP